MSGSKHHIDVRFAPPFVSRSGRGILADIHNLIDHRVVPEVPGAQELSR